MQVVALVVSFGITAVAVALAAQAVRQMVGVLRIGQPVTSRRDEPRRRWAVMLKETLGHTRMLQWHWVGVMHWFVAAGFIFLSTLVFGAYLQVVDPHQAFPVIGHWVVYEWPVEALSWLTLIGIVYLIVARQRSHPRRDGRGSRFFGSTFWQAYFVEAVILAVVVCGIVLRTLEHAILNNAEYQGEHPEAVDQGSLLHFPTTAWLGDLWSGLSLTSLENLVYAIATIKIVVSMTWLIVIARNVTMGVAWHRFTAWSNIWFKREGGRSGGLALGGLQPIVVDGAPLDFENIEDLDEDAPLGVGKVEDFTWKGLLDFTTCTECGRCQSQCPAWNTEKPLSPKLLMMGLRDHAYAKAPAVQARRAAGDGEEAELSDVLVKEAERPLIGSEDLFGVIDPDVLWSCTSCGACVQQCPVDIEHVDHIMDMRRYQVLVESNFPAELNQLFKGLENKGNPWNMSPSARLDWAKDLPFEVKQVGADVEDLTGVEYLFWVGCAGAYEDRAKKTTQAVAELLHTAGVDFAVLGDGETCTGDPARRSGNEFVFSMLAMQNAEVLKETRATKVVATCAHCFNTLKNEYDQFGVQLEVVHHTQLLNRLVREGRLTPAAPGAQDVQRTITYHDPCYLGRHNQVYEPPRELLGSIPGATFTEMPRHAERSFCCGAGGARMWMEENIGERINLNRTAEAVATGADQIAVGCPFCRVMLSDGLTMKQSEGEAREEVEVLDVAQMLLASVRRGQESTGAPGATEAAMDAAPTDGPGAAGGAAGSAPTDGPSPQTPVDELDSPDPDTSAETDAEIAVQHNTEVDEEGADADDDVEGLVEDEHEGNAKHDD